MGVTVGIARLGHTRRVRSDGRVGIARLGHTRRVRSDGRVGIARLGHTRRVRSDGRDCGDREAWGTPEEMRLVLAM